MFTFKEQMHQGSETGSQIRKRRQMEIDITQPQIIPQPEKPQTDR